MPAPLGTESKGRSPWVVGALACGGCLVLAVVTLVVGGGALFHLAMGVFVEQVEADLRDHPVVVEHLGRLEEIELDWLASMAAPGENDFVFEARGTKGSGILRVTSVTVDASTEAVVAGTLELESGQVVELFPETDAASP